MSSSLKNKIHSITDTTASHKDKVLTLKEKMKAAANLDRMHNGRMDVSERTHAYAELARLHAVEKGGSRKKRRTKKTKGKVKSKRARKTKGWFAFF